MVWATFDMLWAAQEMSGPTFEMLRLTFEALQDTVGMLLITMCMQVPLPMYPCPSYDFLLGIISNVPLLC